MAKNVKNIGIDLGNSTICVAGMGADGNIINAYTQNKRMNEIDKIVLGKMIQMH